MCGARDTLSFPEDGDSRLIRKVDIFLPEYTACCPSIQ
jgi:hypothetical protein